MFIRERIVWVASGCVVLSLLAPAGVSQLTAGRSRLSAQPVASLPLHSPNLRAAAQDAAGSQDLDILLATRVLGRDGRAMDRQAVQQGDSLVWQGATVQDESASAVTVQGPLAQVETAQRLLILNISTLPGDTTQGGIPTSQRRRDVIFVLLMPSTRLTLPPGQGFADLESDQAVQVTGTLNWRTHMLLRPTSLIVGAAPHAQQCTTLSVSGDQDCADEPANTP